MKGSKEMEVNFTCTVEKATLFCSVLCGTMGRCSIEENSNFKEKTCRELILMITFNFDWRGHEVTTISISLAYKDV